MWTEKSVLINLYKQYPHVSYEYVKKSCATVQHFCVNINWKVGMLNFSLKNSISEVVNGLNETTVTF